MIFIAIYIALLFGAIEGMLDHFNTAWANIYFDAEKHRAIYTPIRIYTGIMLLLVFFERDYDFVFMAVASLLQFPFMHDGMYAITRNYMWKKIHKPLSKKPYPDGWLSKGNTWWGEKMLNPIVKTTLFIISLVLYILTLIY